MNESRVQIDIQASPTRVFSALTTGTAVTAWFAEHADIDLNERRYDFWGRFTPEAPNRDAGRHPLLTVETNSALKYSWHVYDADTTVAIRLVPRGEKTIVAVTHAVEKPGALPVSRFSFEDFWFLSLENLRRYLDGRKADARIDFTDEAMKGDIQHTIEIDAPASTVFAILIQPEHLNRWIASNASVEPVKDGAYSFGWAVDSPMKILEIEPDQKLSYSWSPMPGESGTVVTWTLEESGGKTRLTLVHSGFAPDQHPGEYAGWRNYQNWVRSLAEYGAAWQPPIVPLPQGWESIYAASIRDRQHELIFEG
ncbi:MAG: SRPBCC domain-containing protein [Anaerolineae bacterium]|nr:SRPBCC domain-containing protein [Anaerolineae bacterium]